jgi:methyl-accepting chemotaxis protein
MGVAGTNAATDNSAMDLNAAHAAHSAWKGRFRQAIENKETLDAVRIGRDDCCELGTWLHGDGRVRLGHLPEFVSLLEKHKEFHREAGFVADMINQKQYSNAVAQIGGITYFGTTSDATGAAILALKKATA